MTQRLEKPASSAARATSASVAAVVSGWPEVEARDLQAEVERHRILLAGGPRRAGAVRKRGGTSVDRRRRVNAGEALAGKRVAAPPAAARSWRGHDLRRHRRRPGRGCGCAPVRRRVEQRRREPGRRGARRARARPSRRPASSPVVSTTVVRRRAQPLGDDEVEHLEGVAARAQVALAAADDRPQTVRRHDLIGLEPPRGPVRLARGGGADEHDEAGVGQAHRCRPTTPRRATPVAWTGSRRCGR